MPIQRCFACGKVLRGKVLRAKAYLVDTRDAQEVYVGPDCFAKVLHAEAGYQPPKGGPRLYPMPEPEPGRDCPASLNGFPCERRAGHAGEHCAIDNTSAALFFGGVK